MLTAAFTLGLLKKMKFLARASTPGQTGKCMKVPGLKTRCTAKENSNGKTERSIRVNSRTISEKVKEFLTGKMVVSTTDFGSTENSTAKVFL